MLRRDIGNTPDTSKALRMLVNARKIIRKGRGGRSDPFLYEIPSCVVEEIMATESEDDSHAQVLRSSISPGQQIVAHYLEACDCMSKPQIFATTCMHFLSPQACISKHVW